jgi:preprotein translocase subunit SecA
VKSLDKDEAISEIKTIENGSNKYTEFTGKKVRRNSPCPCGSGKKFKHCCGAI